MSALLAAGLLLAAKAAAAPAAPALPTTPPSAQLAALKARAIGPALWGGVSRHRPRP